MSRPHDPARPDLYARVTNLIIADLERGVRPWTRPWSAEHLAGRISRPLRHTGEPYNGINVLLLWAAAVDRGFAAPTWMTFRQALALGGCVRKGEHGATVVYADRLTREETDEQGEDVARTIPFLKAYAVFNVAQIDGLPERYAAASAAPAGPERIASADAFFAATGMTLRDGGGQAFYLPSGDYVQMPPLAAFDDAEAYYATLAHEATHWTGHPTRLARDFRSSRWGDAGYAVEELVAELGAAFLCAELGLALTPRAEHADYLGHWLKVLRADHRAIFTAASHAQRAADFLKGQGVSP
ncbi:MAG: ArdC family protein [Phenylobacterium sp.]